MTHAETFQRTIGNAILEFWRTLYNSDETIDNITQTEVGSLKSTVALNTGANLEYGQEK